jgi:hypothetical protein
MLVQHLWLLDVEIKNLGTGLATNLQHISEPLGNQQSTLNTVVLEEGVSSHGGPHTYAPDGCDGNAALESGRKQSILDKDTSDALTGGIRIVVGITGKELVNTRGRRGDDLSTLFLVMVDVVDNIGEGTATIDKEVDLRGSGHIEHLYFTW